MSLLSGDYKGVKFKYSLHNKDIENEGILIINLPNGVESTHIIKGWHPLRVFQYIETMKNLT